MAPLAEEIDRESRFPSETFDKMVKCGFTGIGVPPEYGGSGGGETIKVTVVSEIAKKMCSYCWNPIHSFDFWSSYTTIWNRRTEAKVFAIGCKRREKSSLCFDRTKCRFGCRGSENKGCFR